MRAIVGVRVGSRLAPIDSTGEPNPYSYTAHSGHLSACKTSLFHLISSSSSSSSCSSSHSSSSFMLSISLSSTIYSHSSSSSYSFYSFSYSSYSSCTSSPSPRACFASSIYSSCPWPEAYLFLLVSGKADSAACSVAGSMGRMEVGIAGGVGGNKNRDGINNCLPICSADKQRGDLGTKCTQEYPINWISGSSLRHRKAEWGGQVSYGPRMGPRVGKGAETEARGVQGTAKPILIPISTCTIPIIYFTYCTRATNRARASTAHTTDSHPIGSNHCLWGGPLDGVAS